MAAAILVILLKTRCTVTIIFNCISTEGDVSLNRVATTILKSSLGLFSEGLLKNNPYNYNMYTNQYSECMKKMVGYSKKLTKMRVFIEGEKWNNVFLDIISPYFPRRIIYLLAKCMYIELGQYLIRFACLSSLTLIEQWHWFYWANVCLLSHISEISTAISRINEPISGMFVLIWMYFSFWFQILSWNSTIVIFFMNFIKCLTCRLHSLAAWKALTMPLLVA